MSKYPKWTQAELETLHDLVASEQFTYLEIAEIMRRNVNSVRVKAQKIGLTNSTYMRQKTKHKHLRGAVMRYFLTHSKQQTMDGFGLTESEFKSVTTVCYGLPEYDHLRKETRRHDSWSTQELKFLLQHAGLKPREWIGRKLKRGGALCIKDRLEILGIASKNLHGFTMSQFRALFGREPGFYIQTQAGPTRGLSGQTYWKIIPWVWLESELKARRLKAPKMIRELVYASALFQRWIFAPKDPVRSIQLILKEK